MKLNTTFCINTSTKYLSRRHVFASKSFTSSYPGSHLLCNVEVMSLFFHSVYMLKCKVAFYCSGMFEQEYSSKIWSVSEGRTKENLNLILLNINVLPSIFVVYLYLARPEKECPKRRKMRRSCLSYLAIYLYLIKWTIQKISFPVVFDSLVLCGLL